MSSCLKEICIKKERDKIIIIFMSLILNLYTRIEKIEHKKALNKDGENPAKKTNIKIKKSLIRIIFFETSFEIKFKCIPDNASICESPAFLKLSDKFMSVYSFIPESKARSKPPALPQEYIIRLN